MNSYNSKNDKTPSSISAALDSEIARRIGSMTLQELLEARAAVENALPNLDPPAVLARPGSGMRPAAPKPRNLQEATLLVLSSSTRSLTPSEVIAGVQALVKGANPDSIRSELSRLTSSGVLRRTAGVPGQGRATYEMMPQGLARRSG